MSSDPILPIRKLFVGLFLPAAAARELHAAVRGVLVGDGFRFVQPEEIHLTLRFVGMTPEERIEGLRADLRRSLASLRAPRLTLSRTGTFPESGAARVLWAGVDEDPGTEGTLLALARAAGYAADEPFQPHLTVARPARSRGCPPPEDFRRLALAVRWHPAEVRLVESRPGEAGDLRFPSIESFPLL